MRGDLEPVPGCDVLLVVIDELVLELEDVPAVVEEFYPEEQQEGAESAMTRKVPAGLSGRLQDKVARMGTG